MRYDYKRLLYRYMIRIRNLIIRKEYGHLELGCYLSPRAIIWGKKGITICNGAMIQPFAILQCTSWNDFINTSGTIKIGRGTAIQPYAYLNSGGGSLEIGENCSVNPYCVLYGSEGGLKIGNSVRIATHTIIVPSNHIFDRKDIPISSQGSNSKGIIIEDDVWIGSDVKILDGVRIGKGCVLAAGCVMTHSAEPYGVYAGIPAKRIKERDKSEKQSV